MFSVEIYLLPPWYPVIHILSTLWWRSFSIILKILLFFCVEFKSSSEICFIFVIGFQLWKKPKLVSPCEWKRERELSYATWAYGIWVKITQRGRTCKNKHYVLSSNPRNSGAVFNLESDQLNVQNHKIAIGIMKLSGRNLYYLSHERRNVWF